jgi:hypothetical protein
MFGHSLLASDVAGLFFTDENRAVNFRNDAKITNSSD